MMTFKAVTTICLMLMTSVALAVTSGHTSDGRLTVNGQPTFLFGLAPCIPQDLKTTAGADGWTELKNGGISITRGAAIDNASPTTFQTYRDYLDKSTSHSMYVAPFLYKLADQRRQPTNGHQIGLIMDAFRKHPAVCFWKLGDNPTSGGVVLPAFKRANFLVKDQDPDHLIAFTVRPPNSIPTTSTILSTWDIPADIIITDVYPVNNKKPLMKRMKVNGETTVTAVKRQKRGLSQVGDIGSKSKQLCKNGKVQITTLQVACSSVNPKFGNPLILPTARQQRFMTYHAIVNGSNSLFWFGMTQPGTITDPADVAAGFNWTYWNTTLKPLLSELNSANIYSALCSADSSANIRYARGRVEARIKEVGNTLYIFAVAREGSTGIVNFKGMSAGSVTVLGENRTLTATQAQGFSDTFAEYDVHVYKMNK
jgi:hypothetical protein